MLAGPALVTKSSVVNACIRAERGREGYNIRRQREKTDRQTDTLHRHTDTHRQTDTERERERETDRGREIQRHRGRQTAKQTWRRSCAAFSSATRVASWVCDS